MKRVILSLAVILFVMPFGCKKNQEVKEVSIAKKYARYRTVVNKDKEQKEWGATLEKAEEVDLLAEEQYTNIKGKELKLAKVKLADDTIGYLEARHLAEKPIVFMQNTKAFVRPTSGSKIDITIPRGTIGFIIAEKANWVQVYIGKIKGKWVTKQWVKDGYSMDEKIIQETKEFEAAVILLTDERSEKRSILPKEWRQL